MPAPGWRSPERFFDLGLGASVIGWGLAALLRAPPEAALSPVRLGVAGLHLTVGLLFFGRAAAEAEAPGGPRRLAMALPSLLVSGLAFQAAPAPEAWPFFMGWFFAAAAALTALSLASLGRSFSVLPARRALVRGGPYRLLRHPAYAGELLLLQTVGAAAGEPWVQVLCLLVAPLTILRIEAEEELLRADPAWEAYAAAVPWRLCPGLY